MRTRKRIPIEKILLGLIAATGILAVVAIAPGIGPVFKLFGVKKKPITKQYLSSTLSRMKQKGYIVFEEKNGRKYIRLTSNGKKRLSRYEQTPLLHQKPKRWDGKWRIVIFDIQEKKRNIRDKIRREIKQAGFRKLQESVWVYPYPCSEFVALLKADQRIGKNVLYVLADHIEYDKDIKKSFDITTK